MTTRDAMVETIAAAMFQHRLVVVDGRSQCKCGWWVNPLLDSVHRLHVSDEILAATLLATAQINAENIVEARNGAVADAYDDAKKRTHAVGLLLADSGDITPMGTRMLDKIWERAEVNT